MSYLFPNSEIVSIDYVEKLSEDEDIENIIHATPIQDNNQISILPLVVVEKNIKNLNLRSIYIFKLLTPKHF